MSVIYSRGLEVPLANYVAKEILRTGTSLHLYPGKGLPVQEFIYDGNHHGLMRVYDMAGNCHLKSKTLTWMVPIRAVDRLKYPTDVIKNFDKELTLPFNTNVMHTPKTAKHNLIID